MSEISERKDELKTVSFEKDTWILEVPAGVCRREALAEGTLVSLTFNNGAIQALISDRRRKPNLF